MAAVLKIGKLGGADAVIKRLPQEILDRRNWNKELKDSRKSRNLEKYPQYARRLLGAKEKACEMGEYRPRKKSCPKGIPKSLYWLGGGRYMEKHGRGSHHKDESDEDELDEDELDEDVSDEDDDSSSSSSGCRRSTGHQGSASGSGEENHQRRPPSEQRSKHGHQSPRPGVFHGPPPQG